MYLICLSVVSNGFCRRMVCYLADTFNKLIAESVISRSPKLQLHIEVLNIAYLIIVRVSISTEYTMNPLFVSQLSFAMPLVILSYDDIRIVLFVNTEEQKSDKKTRTFDVYE